MARLTHADLVLLNGCQLEALVAGTMPADQARALLEAHRAAERLSLEETALLVPMAISSLEQLQSERLTFASTCSQRLREQVERLATFTVRPVPVLRRLGDQAMTLAQQSIAPAAVLLP